MKISNIGIIFLSSFLLVHASFEIPPNSTNQTGFCFSTLKQLKALEHEFPVNWIDFPVDHFHNESRYAPHSDKHFRNRFWFDATHYRPGGPVIVQNAGESSGAGGGPELTVGLLGELAKATNGLAVILEHRYFGQSIPIPTRNAEDFRFLSTEQAMADQAYFAQNVVFPGKGHLNLTAPNTPWFAIGCSYPGGLTAFERIQYPDLFWAAISSSGVTAPKANLWEYFNAVRKYSPHECALTWGKVINIADNILYGGNMTQIAQLKTFFQVPTNTSNIAFAGSLEFDYTLQAHNWIPCLNDYLDEDRFCPSLTSPVLLHPNRTERYRSTAEEIIANGGWANESESLTTSLLNYRGDGSIFYYADPVEPESKAPSTDPFVYGGPFRWLRGWDYLKCTAWGYFQTGDGPPNTLPIVSRLLTYSHLSGLCRTRFNIPGIPYSEGINRYGRYNVSYPRLMLVGGEHDPWRPSTPLASSDEAGEPTRLDYPSTLDQPWHVIPKATHCWDYFGAYKYQEPPGGQPESISTVHRLEREAFQRWLKEWHDAHPDYNVYV